MLAHPEPQADSHPYRVPIPIETEIHQQPPVEKKDKGGPPKIGPGAILDPIKRAFVIEQGFNNFEIDFADEQLIKTPEVLELIDIIYFDRRKELQQWLKKKTTEQIRLFLQEPFPRKIGGRHPLDYWWKACHFAARFNRTGLLTEIQKQGVDIYSQDGMNRTILHYGAEHNHLELVKFFSPRARFLINLQDMFGMTPFMLVCQGYNAAHIELCKLFLTLDGDHRLIQRFGYSALMYAIRAGCEENVKALVAAGASVNVHDNELWSPLHLAIYYQFDQIASYLIAHGADVEAKNKDGATALSIASQQGRTATVSILLAKGADPNTADNYGFTPLMFSAQRGHTAIVNALLKTGEVDITAVQHDGFDALMLAAQRKNTDVIKAIVEKACPSNATKDVRYGNNALTLAARTGNAAAITALILKAGFDTNQINDLGQSSLLFAAENGDASAVKKLLDCGSDVEERRADTHWSGLMLTSWFGHADACRVLLDYTADPNKKAYNGMTALHLAAYNGHDKIIDILVAQPGIKLNVRDDCGFTALHLAVQFSHFPASQKLLTAGANSEVWEMHGEYLPIHTATLNRDTNMVGLLVKHGAKINGRQINGRTAVMFAASDDNDEMLGFIVNRCMGDINVHDFTGNTALSLTVETGATKAFKYIMSVSNQIGVHMGTADVKNGYTPLAKAIKLGRKDMIKELLEVGRQPVNGQDNWGKTPLFLACELEDVESIKLLLSHAADPGIANELGETCLSALIGKGNVEALTALLSKGTSILNVRDPSKNGQTPLCTAILCDDDITAQILIEQPGTILDTPDNDGKTPLMFAVEKRKANIVDSLLKRGSDPNYQDKKGRTPMHIACRLADRNSIQQLQERGAVITTHDASGVTPIHILMQTASNPTYDEDEEGAELEFEDNIENIIKFIAKAYNNPKSREDEQRGDSKNRPANVFDTPDGEGNTVLHHLVAIPSPSLKYIGLFITHGASVNMKNRFGMNVLESTFQVSKLVAAIAQIIESKWRDLLRPLLFASGDDDEKIDGEISMIEYSNYGLESQQAQMMVERWINRCHTATNGTSIGLRELSDVADQEGLPAVRQLITKMTAGKKPVFRDSVLNAIEAALRREISSQETKR